MNQDLTAAANRLSDILRQENAALATLDLVAATSLMADKRLAMDAFARARGGDELQTPPLPLEAATLLKDLANENRVLLARAIAVQSRVIGIVARSMPTDPHPLYAPTGAVTRAGRPIAMTLSARA